MRYKMYDVDLIHTDQTPRRRKLIEGDISKISTLHVQFPYCEIGPEDPEAFMIMMNHFQDAMHLVSKEVFHHM